MRRLAALPTALLFLACEALIEVQTDPVDLAVPVTGIALQNYVEIAIDMPPESVGDVVVEAVDAALEVVNPSSATTLTFSLRLSTEGTATPQTPFTFTDATRPAYFAAASVLLPNRAYGPDTRTAEEIPRSAGLSAAVGAPRLYIIVSNTVTSLGLGEALPLELHLEGLTFHAVVLKPLGELSGALELTGL